MIKARADENQSSALKNCVGESKEKGFGNCFPKPNLVGVTGLEPAASTSQTARHRFFASFYVLFRPNPVLLCAAKSIFPT